MNKYKIFCETDNRWETFETVYPTETCPVDNGHTIRAGSLICIGKGDKDYKYLRDEFKTYIISLGSDEETGFNNASENEKLYCCEHKIGTHSQRVGVVGLDNVVSLGLLYHKNVSEARSVRLGYAIAEVHNRLPNDAESIIQEARNAIMDYYMFGVEGTTQGDIEGITDYLNGLGTYSGNGLINKSWIPEGLTMTQLITKIEDILLNGNY